MLHFLVNKMKEVGAGPTIEGTQTVEEGILNCGSRNLFFEIVHSLSSEVVSEYIMIGTIDNIL